MGCSLWGCKESLMTEVALHARTQAPRLQVRTLRPSGKLVVLRPEQLNGGARAESRFPSTQMA